MGRKSDPVERLRDVRERVAELRSLRDKAAGALDAALAKLKRDHGARSIKEAEKLLRRRNKEADAAEREAAKRLREFEDEWGEFLDDAER